MLDIAFNILPTVVWLIGKIKDITAKNQLKKDLALAIEKPLNRALESFDRFYEAFSTALGMSVVSSVIEPSDPEKMAEKVVNRIEREFIAVKKSLIDLMKVVSAHQDEFKQVLRKNEVLLLEITLKAFESEEPDWRLIMEHPKFDERLSKEVKREKKFLKILNEKLDDMNKRNNLEYPFFKKTQAIWNVLSNNRFWEQILRLILEELDKQMKKKER
ncbi:hypothetical protein Ferp_2515 [Ferroglobus placidus DSM 10642]|uniref:Uncharacterized protein n=1 Tax=Ferroglobus placidus (strain DSM 10642 / AEDII12DO) TaxID=589924 RepID=D3S2D1_FERPA|nr:hypothetical protein [Ferroglobus placidus]ADC66622.1 hypothetical protein Ferp_2515 [Ferroglobus placidus DSM 10642]